jgi:DNA-binding protein H-NS
LWAKTGPLLITMSPEQEAVLRSIRKLVDFWHITPKELGAGRNEHATVAPARKAPKAVKVAPVTKYRHPVTSQTWDGDGAQPPWLREALTREGYTVDALRAPVDSPSDTEPEA